jgi:hypothetical protein
MNRNSNPAAKSGAIWSEGHRVFPGATGVRATTGTKQQAIGGPRSPLRAVAVVQDPEHTEGDFLRDLDRATSNRAKERPTHLKDT